MCVMQPPNRCIHINDLIFTVVYVILWMNANCNCFRLSNGFIRPQCLFFFSFIHFEVNVMRCARAKNTLSTKTEYKIHDHIGTAVETSEGGLWSLTLCMAKWIAVCFGSIERICEHMIKTNNKQWSSSVFF